MRVEIDAKEHVTVHVYATPGGEQELISRVLQVPGWSNIFTQPIVNRIEMLSTGVRTDIGIKVFGPDLPTITRVCQQIETALEEVGLGNELHQPDFFHVASCFCVRDARYRVMGSHGR